MLSITLSPLIWDDARLIKTSMTPAVIKFCGMETSRFRAGRTSRLRVYKYFEDLCYGIGVANPSYKRNRGYKPLLQEKRMPNAKSFPYPLGLGKSNA